MSIGTKILAALSARGMSQTALAEKMGISKYQVGKYTRDILTPKAEQLYKIAAALRVSPYLFDLPQEKISMDGDLAGFIMEGIKEGFWSVTTEPKTGVVTLVPSEKSLWNGDPIVPNQEVLRRVAAWDRERTEEKEVLALLNDRGLDTRGTGR